MLTVYIALFVTVLDQLVKWIVQQHMVWGESIPLISGVFHLTYIINPGAAFGILAYQRWFSLRSSSCSLVRSSFPEAHPERALLFSAAIGMLLGGALGNAIDRVRISGVVDFFDFRIWPIFNVADIFICVGVALIVFYFWRHEA